MGFVMMQILVMAGISLLPAQSVNIDSLIQVIGSDPTPDIHKLDAWYQLAKAYQETDIDKSSEVALKLTGITKANDSLYWTIYFLDLLVVNHEIQNDFGGCVKYAKEAIDISRAIGKPWDVAYYQSLLGNALVKQGKFYEALENYREAVEYAKNEKGMVKYQAAFLNNIGGIYHYLGDDVMALDYFLQSHNLKKEHNLTDNLSPSLMNIASVYSKIGKYEEAVESHREAYKLAAAAGDVYYRMKALTGLGFDHYLLKDYPEAESNYLKALELSDSISELTARANILDKLSNVYDETGNRDKAIAFSRQALDLSREIGYSFGIASFTRTLGAFYMAENDFGQALPLFHESIQVAQETNAMDILKESYRSISELYENLRDPSNALKYFKLHSSLRDSLLKHKEADRYTVVQIKYEMEKKGREVEYLSQENQIKELKLSRSRIVMLGFAGLFLGGLLFSVLFIRQNRIRSRQKTIILEQKLLRNQMNPHFIFNTLVAVQRYICDKSAMLATDYLGRFSKLIRFILSSTATDRITLDDEIGFLENYISLQALRFENRFLYEINVDPDIDPEEIEIPTMLIQPFIENAIEHGLRPLKNEGRLTVRFRQSDHLLHVEVEDNGVGRQEAGILKAQSITGHQSMGMEITQERLRYLNKKKDRRISLEINDLTESGKAAGTRVTLEIPYASGR